MGSESDANGSADPSGSPSTDESAGPTPRLQRYRFRVRTADGRELTSAVVNVRLAPLLHSPQWHAQEYVPGDTARIRVQAPGRDGETVNFVVERRDGDSWREIGQTSGAVQSGSIDVGYEMPHLGTAAADEAPAPDAGTVYENLDGGQGSTS
jgi:hypothetical protein